MTIIGDYKTKLTCHEAPGASKNAPVACFMWKCIPEPGLPVKTQALKAEKMQKKTSSELGSQTHQQIVSPKKNSPFQQNGSSPANIHGTSAVLLGRNAGRCLKRAFVKD